MWPINGHLIGDDAAVNRQHRGGPVSPTDPIDCEGPTSPRPMLEEEAEKMMEEKRYYLARKAA